MKWQYSVKNMRRKRLPAIVDRFVWKEKTKGKAGIRKDKVVENVWKEIGGNQKEIMSKDDSGEYKTKVSDMIELREKKTLERKVDGEHLKIYGGLKGDRNENIPAQPKWNTRKTAFSDRPTRTKKEVYK